MPAEDEREPQEALFFATISNVAVRFYCHDKIMETFVDEDKKFHLTCDLCGKTIRGQIGASDP